MGGGGHMNYHKLLRSSATMKKSPSAPALMTSHALPTEARTLKCPHPRINSSPTPYHRLYIFHDRLNIRPINFNSIRCCRKYIRRQKFDSRGERKKKASPPASRLNEPGEWMRQPTTFTSAISRCARVPFLASRLYPWKKYKNCLNFLVFVIKREITLDDLSIDKRIDDVF